MIIFNTFSALGRVNSLLERIYIYISNERIPLKYTRYSILSHCTILFYYLFYSIFDVTRILRLLFLFLRNEKNHIVGF